MKSAKKKNNNEVVKILVVGDWIIDENWIISSYESDLSSHVGSEHFRSMIDNAKAQTLSLGGAGSVARALHGLFNSLNDEAHPKYQIYGMGRWHEKDTKLIASLFAYDHLCYQTPLTLSGLSNPAILNNDKNMPRYALCKGDPRGGTCISLKINSKSTTKCKANSTECMHLANLIYEKDTATARAIRLYLTSAGNDPELKFRIDWEVPDHTHGDFSEEYFDSQNGNISRIRSNPDWTNFNHIIVFDLHKGCINRGLIRYLTSTNENALWYIRTKNMEVDWLNEIPSDKYMLRMIGAEYVPNRSRTKRWFYGKEPSIEAVDELTELGNFDIFRGSNYERWVISLHDDNRMLALYQLGKGKQPRAASILVKPPEKSINVGRTSLVFASCVSSLMNIFKEKDNANFGKNMLMRACINGYNWSSNYSKILKKGIWSESIDQTFALIRDSEVRAAKDFIPIADDIAVHELRERWQKALNDRGIVELKCENAENSTVSLPIEKREFQLWRGYSCIDKYVAVRREVRKELNSLRQAIHKFRCAFVAKESLNCLIFGEPGCGKSLLAEKLAETFDLNPLFFNLAQLNSADQIVDCFDAISSLQNQQRKRRVLVFFDEIDSQIEGQYTFPLFLAPIMDGTYRRGGRLFRLDPCVWIFACSTDLRDFGSKSKCADFISRMNGPLVSLGFSGSRFNSPELKTEQVYLGVKKLLERYGDICEIRESVLNYFYELNLKFGTRSLSQIVKKFRNVQYASVGKENIPVYDEISTLIDMRESEYNDFLKKWSVDERIKIVKESPK